MKILYLTEQLSGGGKERRLIELLKGLSTDKSYELHLVLTKSIIDYPEVNNLRIKIHHLKGFSDFELIKQYYLIFKDIKPDVVHTWSYKTSFFVSILKYFYDFKFIAGFIGDKFGLSKVGSFFAKQLIFRKADNIVSNSQGGLDAYNVPKNKGVVVHNGLDPKRISKKKDNKLTNEGVKTPLKVVMLANVSKHKNYQLFIDIAEHFVNLRDDITFISIGKILPEFKNFADPYINNKHPKIKFLGFRSDVNDLIKDCDIGILCTYSEGISNAIVELMANGVPVITNDMKGGSREIISNKVDGFICTDSEMSKHLNNLINDKNLKKSMSIKATDKIRNNFSLLKMVDHYVSIYSMDKK